MKTKFTFSIDSGTLRLAHQYAKADGRTLADLLTEYVEALAELQRSDGFSPLVRKMIGLVRQPEKMTPEEAKWAYLKKKYL